MASETTKAANKEEWIMLEKQKQETMLNKLIQSWETE